MINNHIIGVGAAGGKAAIMLLQEGLINVENVTIINSTYRDIPEKYMEIATIFKDADGVGKERSLGKEYVVNALKSKELNLDKAIDKDVDNIIIVTSTEGGTGSSASVILATVLSDLYKKSVHLVGFVGEGNDPRSLSNSIEFAQDLNDKITVSLISNAKFLERNVSSTEAEILANKEFANMVRIVTGLSMTPTETNIDKADLTKLVTKSGYLVTGTISLDNIKNKEEFNDVVKKHFDSSKFVETDASCQTIGVILNLKNEGLLEAIDSSDLEFKRLYGTPFEVFKHIQNSESNTLDFIISGSKLPLEYFKGLYNKYKEESSKINSGDDDFFSAISGLVGSATHNSFNMLSNKNNNTKDKKVDINSYLNNLSGGGKDE